MPYARAHPSPRYLSLLDQYRSMHRGPDVPPGEQDETFSGISLLPHVQRIARLVRQYEARTLLDYGCGKGLLYRHALRDRRTGQRWPSVRDYWGLDRVHLYDPCYPPHSEVPRGTFDGVVCTDVLEHCPEEDLPWIVGELFEYSSRFVYANVACFPASKRLPSGENAHCTIRPAAWWRELWERAAASKPEVTWEVWLQSDHRGAGLAEERIGTTPPATAPQARARLRTRLAELLGARRPEHDLELVLPGTQGWARLVRAGRRGRRLLLRLLRGSPS